MYTHVSTYFNLNFHYWGWERWKNDYTDRTSSCSLIILRTVTGNSDPRHLLCCACAIHVLVTHSILIGSHILVSCHFKVVSWGKEMGSLHGGWFRPISYSTSGLLLWPISKGERRIMRFLEIGQFLFKFHWYFLGSDWAPFLLWKSISKPHVCTPFHFEL
jgi:hypothetical protein